MSNQDSGGNEVPIAELEQQSMTEHESVQPPNYNRRYSKLMPLIETLRYGFIALGVLVIVWLYVYYVATKAKGQITTAIAVLAILALLFCAWRILAYWWAWQHFGIKVDSKTGKGEIIQKGPWILGLPYSSNDTLDLAIQNIDTPPRTLIQRKWLFDCDTLLYEGKKYNPRTSQYETYVRPIPYVKDADHLNVIQDYVRSLQHQEATATLRGNELLKEQTAELRGLREDLRHQGGYARNVNLGFGGNDDDTIVDR